MTQSLHDDWPPSTNPYRHYVCVKNGQTKDTGELPADGSTAIVVPVRNGLKFFKLCFHSVLSFTDRPFLFSVVDHLGDLATKKYFRAMHANHQVYLHRYDEERFNFAAEINIGFRAAFKHPQVKYGLVLNADAVVEPFWLSKMHKTMAANAKIGVVGPMSNRALPEQSDPSRLNLPTPAQRVSGFCMLFRREVFEQIGGFDEQFVGGGFEDWDFCERSQRAGWHNVIDGSTHVHHFYRQFRHHEYDLDMQANEERFFKKHPLVYDLVKRGNLMRVAEGEKI